MFPLVSQMKKKPKQKVIQLAGSYSKSEKQGCITWNLLHLTATFQDVKSQKHNLQVRPL